MQLTEEQLAELKMGQPIRLTFGDIRCVLVREDVYQQNVDAGAWTEEEMYLLADEADEIISYGE
jgi:hypothetical protein